jgi:hypothetical protein
VRLNVILQPIFFNQQIEHIPRSVAEGGGELQLPHGLWKQAATSWPSSYALLFHRRSGGEREEALDRNYSDLLC